MRSKNFRQISGTLCQFTAAFMLFMLLTGCTKTYHFNTADYTPTYNKLETRIPLKAALYIPEETRDFNYSFVYKRWALGEALENHLLHALKATFTEVVLSQDGKAPDSIERVVTCSIDKKSDIKIGTVGSDKVATLVVGCSIQDSSQSTLWSGTVNRIETFNAGIVGSMLRLTAFASVFVKSIDVGSAEDMYDAMITSGTNNTLILAVDDIMNKMLNEGGAKICPDCKTKPDWRKTVQPPITD